MFYENEDFDDLQALLDDEGRNLVGNELKIREEATQHEIDYSRAKFYKALHERAEAGLKGPDILNPDKTPAPGMLHPATPGEGFGGLGATPGIAAGTANPFGSVMGRTGGFTPMTAGPGDGMGTRMNLNASAASIKPVGVGGAELTAEEIEKYKNPPEGVKVKPSRANFWHGVSDAELGTWVGGADMSTKVHHSTLAKQLDPAAGEITKKRELQKLQDRNEDETVDDLLRKVQEEFEQKKAFRELQNAELQDLKRQQQEVDEPYMEGATELAREDFKKFFERGAYFGMHSWFKCDEEGGKKYVNQNIKWEMNRLIKKYLVQLKCETLEEEQMGPWDRRELAKFKRPLSKEEEEDEELKKKLLEEAKDQWKESLEVNWFDDQDKVKEKGIEKGRDLLAEKGRYVEIMQQMGYKGDAKGQTTEARPDQLASWHKGMNPEPDLYADWKKTVG